MADTCTVTPLLLFCLKIDQTPSGKSFPVKETVKKQKTMKKYYFKMQNQVVYNIIILNIRSLISIRADRTG